MLLAANEVQQVVDYLYPTGNVRVRNITPSGDIILVRDGVTARTTSSVRSLYDTLLKMSESEQA